MPSSIGVSVLAIPVKYGHFDLIILPKQSPAASNLAGTSEQAQDLQERSRRGFESFPRFPRFRFVEERGISLGTGRQIPVSTGALLTIGAPPFGSRRILSGISGVVDGGSATC